MEYSLERVLGVLRRVARVSHSKWHPYNPEYSLPEERRFELLDADGKKTGELTYIAFSGTKGAVIEAPWGHTTVTVKSRLKTIESIEVIGRPVADFYFSPLRNDVIFTFVNGVVMRFDAQIVRSDMKCTGETGTIAVIEEEGRLEIKKPLKSWQTTEGNKGSTSEKGAPRSSEGDTYRQWRMVSSGIPLVDERDILIAVATYMSNLELVRETLNVPPAMGIVDAFTAQT